MSAWTVAILGATGAVGRVMVEILERSPIEVKELRLLATPRSAGSVVSFRGQDHEVEAVSRHSFDGCDLALFSAGGGTSGEWAPQAVQAGAWVVDNSSRFRMDPEVALVVPEVNASELPNEPAVIANPNCSTIQMVVALHPIREAFGLKRVVVSTYQSVSGAGHKGVAALTGEVEEWTAGVLKDVGSSETHSVGSHAMRTSGGETRNATTSKDSVRAATGGSVPSEEPASTTPSLFAHPIVGNVLPHCDVFLDDGYTREEEKMLRETRKILGDPDLIVQPTCVRVPVLVCHSEAVYIETERPTTDADLRDCLRHADGVEVIDSPEKQEYPMPIHAAGKDPVFVGRIRKDRCEPNGFHFWVVADNLRKGAALNAVQIAERLWRRSAC